MANETLRGREALANFEEDEISLGTPEGADREPTELQGQQN